jgi:acyl carrier protein phosphodiesterase
MNLLAHALLSPPAAPGVLVGNLTADWVKGRARLALPEDMRAGMAIHHRIDVFTDTHPAVHACVERLAPRWQRYAPVLVDIFFDHVLSVRWDRFGHGDRADFIARTYDALRPRVHLLPARAQYASNALLADDWLTAYATLDGIALSLTRLSTRLGHGIELAPAVADFVEHRALFDATFDAFFPALRRHALGDPPP